MSTPDTPSNGESNSEPPAYTPPPAYGAPPAYTPSAPTGAGSQAPGAYPGYGQSPSPYPAAPNYPAPGANPYAAAPPYGYSAVKTNVLSIISMIASIAGFIWILPFIGSLGGAIMGHIALKQIARTGEKGRGMALAGVIVGWVGLAFLVLGVFFILAFIPFAATTSYYS